MHKIKTLAHTFFNRAIFRMVRIGRLCAIAIVILHVTCCCFKLTSTVPQPRFFFERGLRSCKFASNLSKRPKLGNMLKGRSEVGRRHEQRNIGIMMELARVYWERILLYNLVRSGNGIQWTDLVQRERLSPDEAAAYAEKACLEAVDPLAFPALVTPVYRFMRDFGLPLPLQSRDYALEDVEMLVTAVGKLHFLPNDPNLGLARALHDAVNLHLTLGNLPSFEEMEEYVSPVYHFTEKYRPIADCRSDLPPIDVLQDYNLIVARFRTEGKCTVIGGGNL